MGGKLGTYEGRKPLAETLEIFEMLRDTVNVPLYLSGSARRKLVTCGDLDIVAVLGEGHAAYGEIVVPYTTAPDVLDAELELLIEGLKQFGELGNGRTRNGDLKWKQSLVMDDGFQVDVQACAWNQVGACQMYLTGSQETNIRQRRVAKGMGLLLNQWGLFRRPRGGESVDYTVKSKRSWAYGGWHCFPFSDSEVAIYAALGLEWLEPEER